MGFEGGALNPEKLLEMIRSEGSHTESFSGQTHTPASGWQQGPNRSNACYCSIPLSICRPKLKAVRRMRRRKSRLLSELRHPERPRSPHPLCTLSPITGPMFCFLMWAVFRAHYTNGLISQLISICCASYTQATEQSSLIQT